MQKDFDKWNDLKKSIDAGQTDTFANPREVWWCSLGVNVGIETDGKPNLFERPVLVLKVFNAEMIWVLPITSVLKEASFRYVFTFNHTKQSVVVTQIRTISTKRLRRKVGTIPEEDFKNIQKKLINIIQNETPPFGGESRRPKP